MSTLTPLEKLTIPVGGQVIELQQLDYEAGGMSLLRTRIREKSRFTVFDMDPQSARHWGKALLRWADSQPQSRPDSALTTEPDAALPPPGIPMSTAQLPVASAVDVVFPLIGSTLPRDHAQVLLNALCSQWPWLKAESQTGVHGIKLVPGTQAQAMLSHRTRLLLRVPTHRAPELLASTGFDLDVAGEAMRLGTPHTRELLPHATLYAYRVAAASADEVAFMAEVTRELAELGIGGERVCGKRQQLTLADGVLDTFSLMLHALAPEQSLRVQCQGIGPHRLLGCGIFIPHKSAAAV